MSEAVDTRAEILKLGRLLGCEAGELAYLEPVGSAELSSLREQVTEALFDSHLSALKRLAASSRLLPVGLVAQLGERVFGPLLSARIAGLLEPDRAVEIAAKLPVAFLADVACELDPRRASEVIARIPPAQIAAVSRELLARREYVTMGRFVGHLPDASIEAALGTMEPLAILEVGLVLENKDALPELMALLDGGRLEAMVAAADQAGLGQEALELVALLPEAQRQAMLQMPALQRRLSA